MSANWVKSGKAQHTYFSDRLFVLYTPDELVAFLRSVMTSSALSDTPNFINDETARGVLARVIIHSSRLNTIDVVRALAHGWTEEGFYKIPSGTLTLQPRYRLVVGVQLAIEVVLRSKKLAARTARDPRLRQMAVDTLYMISREWEHGKTEIDLSDPALAKHLLRRRGKDTNDLGDGEAIWELEKTVMEANAAELTGALARLSELLCDFQALYDAIEKEARGPDELALAMLAAGTTPILAGGTTPITLLRKPPTGSQRYFFRFDYDGNELPPPPLVAKTAAGTPPEIAVAVWAAEITALVAFGREVVGAMNLLGLTFSDLSGIGLLPLGLSQDEVTRVIARLDTVAGSQRTETGTSADLVVLRGLSEAFAARGPILGWATDLAVDVAQDAGGPPESVRGTLRAMARFLDFASLATVTDRAALDAWWQDTRARVRRRHRWRPAIPKACEPGGYGSSSARTNLPDGIRIFSSTMPGAAGKARSRSSLTARRCSTRASSTTISSLQPPTGCQAESCAHIFSRSDRSIGASSP